jgi:hypothetical protein
VNTELANTSEKMGRKRASCALSGSATLSPMKANTRTKAVTEKQRDETAPTAGATPSWKRKPTAVPTMIISRTTTTLRTRSAIGSQQRSQDADKSRLGCPGRTEQALHSPRGDAQVRIDECLGVAEKP